MRDTVNERHSEWKTQRMRDTVNGRIGINVLLIPTVKLMEKSSHNFRGIIVERGMAGA